MPFISKTSRHNGRLVSFEIDPYRSKGLEVVAVQRQLTNVGWELGALWAEKLGKDCAGNGLGDEPGGTVGHHHVCTTGVTAGDKW